MALGDPYCTAAELREYCQITDGDDDVSLTRVVAAISNGIENYCRRQFNDSGSATARVFYPESLSYVVVDDFSTTTGLLVKTGTTTFSTTIANTNYTLEPLNGVVHGRPGFPYRKIRLYGTSFVTSVDRRPTVEVTARWGWTAVPPDIKTAALMQGARKFRRRYSPSGLQTVGTGDMAFTAWVSRIDDPDVVDLLRDFVLPSFRFC
jgi:hypothetical protein